MQLLIYYISLVAKDKFGACFMNVIVVFATALI